MSLSKATKVGGFLFALLILVGLSFSFWHFKIEPGLLWHFSLDQAREIQEGIMLYNETHTNPPPSLEAVVHAKQLPERSSIYASALRYQTLRPKAVSFSESDFELLVEGTDTVIRLKPEVLKEVTQFRRLQSLNFNAIGGRVSIEDRIIHGSNGGDRIASEAK